MARKKKLTPPDPARSGVFLQRLESAVTLRIQRADYVLIFALSEKEQAQLARSLFAIIATVSGPFEPPFIVRLRSDYDVDVDQTTPRRTDAWAFDTLEKAKDFTKRLEDEVGKFVWDSQYRFEITIPAVPEDSTNVTDETTIDDAMLEFRAVMYKHFQHTVGEAYWQNLEQVRGPRYIEKVERLADNLD